MGICQAIFRESTNFIVATELVDMYRLTILKVGLRPLDSKKTDKNNLIRVGFGLNSGGQAVLSGLPAFKLARFRITMAVAIAWAVRR